MILGEWLDIMTVDNSSANAEAPLTVVNTRGFDLPKTGDNGTMMFTVVGTLLMVGAVAVLYLVSGKKSVQSAWLECGNFSVSEKVVSCRQKSFEKVDGLRGKSLEKICCVCYAIRKQVIGGMRNAKAQDWKTDGRLEKFFRTQAADS